MGCNADHQAWKQRIAQELSRASAFHYSTDSLYQRSMSNSKAEKSRQSQESRMTAVSGQSGFSYASAISSNPRLRRYFDANYYTNSQVNMAYSFGGKTPIRQAFKEPVKQENPVLSRPSTAGSLRSKTSMKLGYVETTTVLEPSQVEEVKNPVRSVSRQSVKSKSSLHSRKLRIPGARSISRSSVFSNQRLIQAGLSELDPPTPANVTLTPSEPEKLIDKDADESEKTTSEIQDDISELESIRPDSAMTWQTTSSQRRYIGELEKLLLEERRRRTELEKKVDALAGLLVKSS